ncbi:MAG: YcaO-like family protein [Acidobacteria bacterium]|nr:YcaO-like family protein [Acidobacteriota bacterium]MBI3424303.1 YcaO-like family protein [Acidobacteriota bacterium]
MSAKQKSLRRLFDALEYIVDEHLGIVQFVTESPRQPGSPDFFHFFAQACNTDSFSEQANFNKTGGASAQRGIAMAKAIGESVERYCGALYQLAELPLHPYANAPFRCVHPAEFALLSPAQYQNPKVMFVPFDEHTPVRWAPAVDPLRGESWHVPAAMVYVPYIYHRGQGDSPIAQSISTGLACHCSYFEAAISALCEVIERDAFTITWQARLAPPQIRAESLSARNRDLVARFENAGYEVTLFDMTLDAGVPTVLSVSRNTMPEAPPLVPAGSASLDPEEAVRKSLEELAHTLEYCQKIMIHMPRLANNPHYDNVEDQTGHLNFWCDHAKAPLANFLFASPARIDFGSLANLSTGEPGKDLQTLLQKLRAVNHMALLCDLTTPDVQEVGLSVVRAIIPGFHPLAVGHSIRAQGGNRLWTIPQQLGYAGITREKGDNSVPHPYP